MYVWIDGERWAGDDQPPLREEHGYLVGPHEAGTSYLEGEWYGRILSDIESLVIVKALVRWRSEPMLPVPGEEKLTMEEQWGS